MKLMPSIRLLGIAGVAVVVLLLNGLVMSARLLPRATLEILAEAPLPLIVRAPGHLDAKSSVTIKGQFDGSLLSKKFYEGQKVEAGQVLAVVDTDKIRIEHQEKQDALANAKADLQRARKEVRLQKSLYKSQAVAYASVEEAQNALTKSAQSLRAAEEAWRQEQVRWGSAKVISPIQGTVVKDGIGDDKSVVSGKEIVTVADMSDFTVRARVDELDIKRVEENQPAEVRVQIYPQNVFKARVAQVGTQPETPDSTAIPVVLTLTDNQGVLLRPKLSADTRIIMGATPPVISVPLSAIHNADGKVRVWVMDVWGRIRARAIVLGQTNPERGEVTSGLRVGERVCVTAQAGFADGMKVLTAPAEGSPPKKSLGDIVKRLWHEAMKGKA